MATRVSGALASGSIAGSGYQLAYGAAIQVGDLLAIGFRSGNATDTCTGVTDSVNSGGWSRAVFKEGDGFNVSSYIYFKIANAAGTPTVTVAFSDAPSCRASVHAYRGTFAGSPLGQSSVARGTSTSPASGDITTASDETVVLGVVAASFDLGSPVFTNTGALTVQASVTPGAYTSLDALPSAPTVYGATGTFDVSDRWSAIVVAFRETIGQPITRYDYGTATAVGKGRRAGSRWFGGI